MSKVIDMHKNNYECDLELFDDTIMRAIGGSWKVLQDGDGAPFRRILGHLLEFVLMKGAYHCLEEMAFLVDIALTYEKAIPNSSELDKATASVLQFPNNQSTKVH